MPRLVSERESFADTIEQNESMGQIQGRRGVSALKTSPTAEIDRIFKIANRVTKAPAEHVQLASEFEPACVRRRRQIIRCMLGKTRQSRLRGIKIAVFHGCGRAYQSESRSSATSQIRRRSILRMRQAARQDTKCFGIPAE
jgi:hypothetical protein